MKKKEWVGWGIIVEGELFDEKWCGKGCATSTVIYENKEDAIKTWPKESVRKVKITLV